MRFLFVIKATDEFWEIGVYSKTYLWGGGEVKLQIAVKDIFEPKIYSSKKRAEQGIKSLNDKLAHSYKLEVIPKSEADNFII